MPVDVDQPVAALAGLELPTPDEEIWRYSRIDQLNVDDFQPADHTPEVSGGAAVVEAGGAVEARSDVDLFPDDTPDVFAALSKSFSGSTVSVSVPAGAAIAEPIFVDHAVAGGGALSVARLAIDVGENAEVTVIERFRSAGSGAAMFIPVVQLRAAASARVRYLAVNELGEQVWSIGHQQSVGLRDSSTLLATVALGGYYARVRTEARLEGRGGSTRQVALYFADGDQMHDFRTIQDHAAPHTSSDLLFKGAVQDRSRSVYTGLIKIREDADGSTAYQTNRNLTLSEGAWAESVPNLDIRTNDVKCSHASTVGPIDADQRFYLESRGVPPETAERLVVLGFFDEVLSQLPAGDLADELRRNVATKLSIGAGS